MILNKKKLCSTAQIYKGNSLRCVTALVFLTISTLFLTILAFEIFLRGILFYLKGTHNENNNDDDNKNE